MIPPQWAPHRAIWTAWPSHVDAWGEDYIPVREEIIPFIKELAKGERVKLLATGDEAVSDARLSFENDHVDVVHAAFSSLWLRDTGPLFAKDKHGPLAVCMKFNGWGGRVCAPYDEEVAGFIARASGLRIKRSDLCLEGGSAEFDGEGRALLSRAALLDPARNPDLTPAQIGDRLQSLLGVTQILWLDGAQMGDPTGGQVHLLARFVGPRRVLCQEAFGPDDPGADLYERTASFLQENGLEVIRLPSPGRVLGTALAPAPASHLGFVIGNQSVIMPSFGSASTSDALAVLQELFPLHRALALPARHLLGAGRSFSSLVCPEPAF